MSTFNIFDKHALTKSKCLRINEASFMTKELDKEITERSILSNNFLKPKSQKDQLKYNKQRNFCKKLVKINKKLYFTKLDIKNLVDNRSFWKTVLLLFSTKYSNLIKLSLMKAYKYAFNNIELCQIF